MNWRRVMIGSFGAIFYVLVGYPVSVILLARAVSRSRGMAEGGFLPSVTVVVAAYNEESVIAARIENLLALDYPSDRLSIVVVADGSDDATAAVARSFGDGVKVLADGQRRGKAAAINRAIAEVVTEVVVFSDANNEYEPEGLTRLVAPFSNPSVGAVTGAKRVRPRDDQVGMGEGLYWKYESRIKSAESRLGSCVAVIGEMLAVRTVLVDVLPEHIINDDFYIAMQVLGAGFDVVYRPDAVSWEPPSSSSEDDRLRRERIVAGRMQALTMARRLVPWKRPVVAWQVVSHKLSRPLIPVFAATGLAATLLSLRAALKGRGGMVLPAAALAGQAALYGAARVGKAGNEPGRIPKVAAYLFDSNRASVGGVLGFLRGRQDVLWAKASRDPAGLEAGER